MKLHPLAPLALLLAAGCLAAPPEAADAPSPADGTREAWLTKEMRFAVAMPEARASVRSGAFYQDWAEGTDYPTWESAPYAEAVRVTRLRADLAFDASGPVAQSPRFPDLMVYGGAGGAWMGFNSTNEHAALVPGQVYRWTTELALPTGGLWIPAGEKLGIKVVPVMLQNDAADVRILLGGEDGSRVAWEEAPGVEVATVQGEGARGDVAGTAYAGPAAPPTTSHATRITLAQDPRALLAWMNVTDAQGFPDVDLAVLGPDGAEIAASGTPTPREFVRLGPDNLRGLGEYSLVVTTYGSARAAFTLEWRTG